MRAWPDAASVDRALSRIWRRLVALEFLTATAWSLGVAAVVLFVGERAGWSASMRLVAALSPAVAFIGNWLRRAAGSRASTAGRLEARHPPFRNIVITAAEIIAKPDGIRADVGERVCRDAARALDAAPIAQLFPWTRQALGVAGAAMLMTATVLSSTPGTRTPMAGPSSPTAARIDGIRATVTPPAYTGRAAETLTNPQSIAVLAGSTIDLSATADAASVSLETTAERLSLTRTATDFSGRVTIAADGFLAIQPLAADGTPGARRLIGVTVTPDRPPVVRITAPGRDMLVDNGRLRLQIAIDAIDDLALDRLSLAYTKASGSGENFDFTRGDVPVTVTRTDDRHWTATAAWSLESLQLEPGDFVVYRAIASDRRPGMTPSESDVFMVEVVAPGSVAAEGFAIADDQDRYALSQRMVIVKTERLIARKATLSAEDFADETQGLAAEQRHVRAEFIFMMGGELEAAPADASDSLNEEEEAAGESDLLAGRSRNQGRLDLLTATRRMSEAATLLSTMDMKQALVAEKAALESLQKAFSKSRYLLRALATREGLDMARRLSGSLTGAASDCRAAPVAEPDTRVGALRRVLADVADLSGRAAFSPDDAARAVRLAEDLLRLDATSDALRKIAADLTAAATSMRASATAPARAALTSASTALVTDIRTALPALPAQTGTTRDAALRGALADAHRRKGGR